MRNMDVLMAKLVADSCPNEYFPPSKKLKKYLEENCRPEEGCRRCWLGWLEREVRK